MKTFKNNFNVLLSIVFTGISVLCIYSCKKQDDWLNKKSRLSDVTPSTLKDFQAVLDGDNVMNSNYPDIGLLGTDNSYITSTNLAGTTETERNSYLWAKDIFDGQSCYEWDYGYQTVEYANIVLDGLQKIQETTANRADYNRIKGSALFYRAIIFYNLAQLFSKPYTPGTATSDLSIPLRLSSDINIPSVRATVQQTYNQIVSDLKTAVALLPVSPLYTTRPCQASANGLLAKVYLDMSDYADAGKYADNALQQNNTLLDYNSNLVNPTSTYRFPSFATGNPEITFYATATGYTTLWAQSRGIGNVDTVLYRSYEDNDLRKSLYFINKGNNNIKFQGSYSGAAYNFSGIANDELYLIRAECYARAGNTTEAMKDLNTLLAKRWKTGTFTPYTADNSSDALTKILEERRKELPFTALIRWEDLRRLNLDQQTAVTVTHKYNGTEYTLPPNDKRYVYPLPDKEIQVYHLTQNDR